jgi:hypothetical protein
MKRREKRRKRKEKFREWDSKHDFSLKVMRRMMQFMIWLGGYMY